MSNIVDKSCNCAHCLMNTFLSVSSETLKAANLIGTRPDKLKQGSSSNNNNSTSPPAWLITFQNSVGSDSIPSSSNNMGDEELKQAGSTESTSREPNWLTTFRHRIL